MQGTSYNQSNPPRRTFPVPIAHHCTPIQGVSTEIVVQRFSETTLVFITQTGKIGTIIQGSFEPEDVSGTLNLTTTLGPRNENVALEIYARHIAQILASKLQQDFVEPLNNGMNLILGISLKPNQDEKKVFRELSTTMQNLI